MSLVRVALILAIAMSAAIGPANSQTANPATQGESDSPEPPKTRLRSFEMPPITVFGTAPLREEELIGDYAQPRWTAARRFGETRVYVVPKGTAEFEFWLIPERGRDGDTETTTQYEFEFGLPHRFQLDLYLVGHQTNNDGPFGIDGQKVELRYALADWGKIWGNPTLYAEWKDISDAPSHIEVKLLLGGQLASRWHWGSNFVWEHETGGTQETSNEWTTGVSYAAWDTKASFGVETQLALVDSDDPSGGRTPYATAFLIGPSIQVRPLPEVHLDLAPLFGVTNDSPRVKLFLIFGWEF